MNAIRVLIIEDDNRIAQMHRFFVEKIAGFEIVGIAQNFNEALELIKLLAPDLLLLDLYMPDGNGMDILHQLRGKGQAIDVILITAARHVKDVQQAMRAGAFDYLIKPVVFSRFEQTLTRFLHYHGQLQQANTLEQYDIDGLHPFQTSSIIQTDNVPKGIDILTLGKVQQAFKKEKSKSMSAEEVGKKIGVSRSTARRYLEYMITIGELKPDVIYGSVGRPERRYFPQIIHDKIG
ncbi:MAG: response regulator [Desulfobacteraceae bacterium]|nr:response regulator [Desulfobacteraceae bacterium]